MQSLLTTLSYPDDLHTRKCGVEDSHGKIDLAGTSARIATQQARQVEWVTLGLIVMCYGLWAAALFWIVAASTVLGCICMVLALVLHASLTHEVTHGHPLPSRVASEALVHFNPGLAVPYLRFRDTHLAHHQDAILTDPYDDPESNYLDPANWARMPEWLKLVRLSLIHI